MDTRQINVHLPVEVYEKLRLESFETRRSMSELVRELLSEHQEKRKKDVNNEASGRRGA